MASRMSEFREFVSLHPRLRDEVKDGKKTWQNIYEEWVLYGNGDKIWGKYRDETEEKTNTKKDTVSPISKEGVKNMIGQLKNINPEKINKTLNNVQKIIQIVQTVNGGKAVSAPVAASAFADWWD